jgi:plastocyanin
VKAVRLSTIVLLLALGACAQGASGGASSDEPVETNEVALPKSYLFEPAAISVPAGTTVTWTNEDEFTHSVRLLEGEEFEGMMKPGETLEFTFDEPGSYPYDCSLHPKDMKGTVQVT